MVMDDIFKTIDNNQNLSEEVKDNFKTLLMVYENNNPNLDLDTIKTNIANLKVTACSKYVIKEPMKYINLDNTLYFNPSVLEKGYDYRFLLMRELMLMQTYKQDITKQHHSHLDPLYEGYASIGANYYVGNEGLCNPYEDEIITVNLLGQIIGKDYLEELFVNNNQELLIDGLVKTGNTMEDIKKLMDLMNYNNNVKDNPRGKSMLKEIQLELLKMYANKIEKGPEETEKIRSLLYGNNNVFEGKASRYQDINHIYQVYEEMALNFELEEPSVSKAR